MISEIDPLGKPATYIYDPANELRGIIDRDHRERAFTYDADGRLTTERWLDPVGNGIRTFTYTYDGANELTQVTGPDSTYAMTYDADGRMVSLSNSGTPNMP